MGVRVRSTRRAPKCYALSLELLEDRQLLSWSALAHAAAPAPAFVGPVQASVVNPAPTAATQPQTVNAIVEPDSTPDDSEYSNSASGTADTTPPNFVGPLQTTTGQNYTSTTGNTTASYTKDYTQTSSDYSSYTYYKSSNVGPYYPADQSAVPNESAAVLDAKPPAPLAQARCPIGPRFPSLLPRSRHR